MSTQNLPRDIDAVTAVLRRLTEGIPVTAIGVRSARTAEISRMAHASGHNIIWVDLEHSAMPIDTATQICAAACDLGLIALVRVPEREYGVIGRLLDGGAMGIIVPRVETVEQAKDVVTACRFPPQGHRSAIAQLPQFGYAALPPAQLYASANRNTLVKVLIESPLGIDQLPNIAAVDGVDLVGIGANDLSAELGVPGDYRHPLVREALQAALSACRQAGKPLAIGGIGDQALMAELIAQGAVPFVMTGIDTEMLLSAARERMHKALLQFSSKT